MTDPHRNYVAGEWLSGAASFRSVNPSDLSDVVGDYAEASVKDVATAGERMPHKSTYFFPKPLTGLVINVMEG